jgi:hypothetical protein
MHRGVDSQSGLAYDGPGNPDLPVVSTSNVSQAKLIKRVDGWRSVPSQFLQLPDTWVFSDIAYSGSPFLMTI